MSKDRGDLDLNKTKSFIDESLICDIGLKETASPAEFKKALEKWWGVLDPLNGPVNAFSSREELETLEKNLKKTIQRKHTSGSHAVDECLKLFRTEVILESRESEEDVRMYNLVLGSGEKVHDLLKIAAKHCERKEKETRGDCGSRELITLANNSWETGTVLLDVIKKANERRRTEAKEAVKYMIDGGEGLEGAIEGALNFTKARIQSPSSLETTELHGLARTDLGSAFIDVFNSMSNETKKEFVTNSQYAGNLLQAAMYFASRSRDHTLTPGGVIRETLDPYWDKIPGERRLEFVQEAAEALRHNAKNLERLKGRSLKSAQEVIKKAMDPVLNKLVDDREPEKKRPRRKSTSEWVLDAIEAKDPLTREVKKLMTECDTSWQITDKTLEFLDSFTAGKKGGKSDIRNLALTVYISGVVTL